MGDKQVKVGAKVRQKYRMPDSVPVWASESGWASYESGVLTVKMDFGQPVKILVQDLSSVTVKPSGPINQRGSIQFNRADESFGDRQQLVFTRADEPLFLQLKQLLDDEQQRGTQGQLCPEEVPATAPEAAADNGPSDSKIRSKFGIPAGVPILRGNNGWVAYNGGVLIVKMSMAEQATIAVQDIVDVKFTRAITGVGQIRFNRADDTFTTRQTLNFWAGKEQAFLGLKQLLEEDKAKGVTGTPVVPGTAGASVADDKYRAKYKIPEDALLARAVGVGYVAFDGHYVTIQHVGLGRVTIGKGVKRIPVTAISSVQIKPPGLVMSGFIQFSIAGGNEKRSAFGHQTMSAVEDENSVVFVKGEEAEFLAMRDAIEAAQRAIHQPQEVPVTPAPDDVFAQLEKLGKLRDAGIVSDAEFEAKKAELLARM
ncbi:DUF4429 domain-containing protein [Arthrobacter sp. MDT2-16]